MADAFTKLLIESFKELKEQPDDRNALLQVVTAARLRGGYPFPGTTLKHLKERHKK